MSAIPASPNDERKLFHIDIEPSDVKDLVPSALRAGMDDAAGPTWHVRVGGGLEGARAYVRWVDSRYEDIEKIFGVRKGEPNLEGLVVNLSAGTNIGAGASAASLNAIAKAVAARVWARFADRVEGDAAGALQSQAELDGWVDEITHVLDTKGVASTGVRLPDKGISISLESLLDDSTRAVLFKLPQPAK